MGGHLGRFKGGFGAGTGVQAFEFGSKGREKFLFGLKRPSILRGALPS